MRILVLLPRFPYPLDKGDKLRAYHQIVELSKRHEVYLFALSHTKVPHDHHDHLHTYCTAVDSVRLHWWESALGIVKAFLAGKPLQLGYWSSRRARRAYDRWEQQVQPDVVYCQMVRTIPTVARHLTQNTKRYVLDYQDALSLNTRRRMERSRGPLKWVLRYEYKALQRTEQQALRFFDATTVISPADRDAITQTSTQALKQSSTQTIKQSSTQAITLVPNGVDTDYFTQAIKQSSNQAITHSNNQAIKQSSNQTITHSNNQAIKQSNNQTYTLVFTGNMSYAPNVDAACWLVKAIMPLVWAQRPYGMKVLIAGADPKPAVKALAGPDVTVSGRLDDIRRAYASAKIFVAPMRIGSGMQNKLLEAMAMHLPCVTTSLAANPLGAAPGEHLLVGDNAAALADLILKLDNDQLHDTIADAGHRFVQEHYSWPAAVAPLEQLLTQYQTHNN